MKLFILGILFSSSLLVAETPKFEAGAWKLKEVGCSNPSYVPTEEEKAFIEEMSSGRSYDLYSFTDSLHGIYEQKFTFPKTNSYCIGKSPFDVNYIGDGRVELVFAYTKWTLVSPTPNVTIKCDDSGPHTETHSYRWQGADLVFLYQQEAKCGEYHMIWAKEK